jgi:hypothetical protein
LGLLSGTPVWVALQKPRSRQVGDLLVSTIDPENWPHLRKLECEKHDVPGVLAAAFGAVKPLNIALAEAITVDSGSRHHITLVCEPHQFVDDVGSEIQGWTKSVSGLLDGLGFSTEDVSAIHTRFEELEWYNVSEVDEGWLRKTGWRQHLEKLHPELDTREIDLTAAVVSADTTERVLRFVFPRPGARTVEVEHRDSPGALSEIAQRLADAKFNILSALLRRGGAKWHKAQLLAVVEPVDLSPERVDAVLEEALRDLPVKLMPEPRVGRALPPGRVIYPRRPDEIVVRVPSELLPKVQVEAEKLPKNKIPVFISRRFVENDPRSTEILTELRRVLDDRGFYPVEGIPNPGTSTPSSYEVQSKMWISRACILLVTTNPDARAFSVNLAHEAGFFLGQGKPLLPLVQKGAGHEILEAANFAGMMLSEFSKEAALSRNDDLSIARVTLPFLTGLFAAEEGRSASNRKQGLTSLLDIHGLYDTGPGDVAGQQGEGFPE